MSESPSSGYTLWVVDTSLSMAIEDIPSMMTGTRMSRLDRAKSLIQEGISGIDGQHAVVSYARESRVESPFTTDKAYLESIVSSLTLSTIYGGSDISSALTLMHSLYANHDTRIRVIFLTDGGQGDIAQVDMSDIFDISFIGIGSPLGDKIPLGYTIDGERRYKSFSGTEVVVPYDREYISSYASRYGATFYDIGTGDGLPASLRESSIDSSMRDIWLILACFSIILGLLYHPYVARI